MLSPSEKDFQQRMLSSFCLDGKIPSGLKADLKRAQVYRDLIFHNFENSLRHTYPLTYTLLKGKKWKELVTSFLASFPSSSPCFWKMPKGLWEFAIKEKWDEKLQVPYLLDLLEFEWIEIEVFMMPDQPSPPFQREGNLLTDPFVLNPEHLLTSFSYPVYAEFPLKEDVKRGNYSLLCYRHPDDLQVHFIALPPFYRDCWLRWSISQENAEIVLSSVAERHGLQLEKRHWEKARQFLGDLLQKKAIYGFKKGEKE